MSVLRVEPNFPAVDIRRCGASTDPRCFHAICCASIPETTPCGNSPGARAFNHCVFSHCSTIAACRLCTGTTPAMRTETSTARKCLSDSLPTSRGLLTVRRSASMKPDRPLSCPASAGWEVRNRHRIEVESLGQRIHRPEGISHARHRPSPEPADNPGFRSHLACLTDWRRTDESRWLCTGTDRDPGCDAPPLPGKHDERHRRIPVGQGGGWLACVGALQLARSCARIKTTTLPAQKTPEFSPLPHLATTGT